MKTCKRCGSYAINPNFHGRLQGIDLDICDVCYWRKRAEEYRNRVEAFKWALDIVQKYPKLVQEVTELSGRITP